MDFRTSNATSKRGPVSIRVVEAVAAREGIDPFEVSPPLHDSIDPAALDALFEPTMTGDRATGTVTFRFHDYRVRVGSDGSVGLGDDPDTEKDSGVGPETDAR
ncbi:HalOD1 output domain-containing protein [Natrinema marinum]|uniref:HalOD1 output domain-containing protein n=1 Tax=Natrinema marinum TaxID=2961598 RepID=UPI0020C8EDD5|nr:HalOD1 output domain-containing protein [Natrinema marinum]